MKKDNIDYLSGEVQEILASPPPWVSTWGTSVILGVIATLVFTGIFFTYPETVVGDIVLTTAEPPVPVISPNSGYLSEMKVKEGVVVKKGDVLAVFSSYAQVDDVLQLEKEVEKLSEFDLSTLRSYKPNVSLKLGELSPSYASFVSVFEYLPFTDSDQTDRSAIYAMNNYVQQIENSMKTLSSQKEAVGKELVDLQNEFWSVHYEYARTNDEAMSVKLFEAKRKESEKGSQIESIDVAMNEKRKEAMNQRARMLEMQVQHQAGAKEKIFQIKQALSNLKSQIQQWKEQYLVTAPRDGKVAFYEDITDKDHINKNDEIMAIVPNVENPTYMGRVRINEAGSGKVGKNQSVVIKLKRYPFRDFGFLKGKVTKTYPLQKDDHFYVEVKLENSLHTTTGLDLEYFQNMSGKAEIITSERSFISRIFGKVFLVKGS